MAEKKTLSDLDALKQSKFFDASWYLEQYPDVKSAGIAPEKHYKNYGWRLGRDPSPGFSTSKYLEANPEVKKQGVNPLIHYIKNEVAKPVQKSKISGSSNSCEVSQLAQTQGLLEYYFRRCQELEYQLLDQSK